jgi:hypothetical protein
MRRPRVKFTVRGLMIAVAVTAIVLGGCLGFPRNRAQREWLAGFHQARAQSLMKNAEPGTSEIKDPAIRAKLRWHEAMAEKYRWATHYPWLPVGPDPPEPD